MRSTLLIALACSAAAIATPALGQTADDQATTGSGTFDPSQAIIVTGSRVSDRTVADSPVPVDVIGGEQLQHSGYYETKKDLNQLVLSSNFRSEERRDRERECKQVWSSVGVECLKKK